MTGDWRDRILVRRLRHHGGWGTWCYRCSEWAHYPSWDEAMWWAQRHHRFCPWRKWARR